MELGFHVVVKERQNDTSMDVLISDIFFSLKQPELTLDVLEKKTIWEGNRQDLKC